jgi:hypothetical protein
MQITTKLGASASTAMALAIGFSTTAQASPLSIPVPPKTLNYKLTTVSHPKSDPIVVSIPAGTYDVTQGSFDDAHPNQVEQLNERWYAVFYDAAGAPVSTTSTTPDLLLADVSKTWTSDPIVLTGNATSVVYFHAPGGEGPDSVYPNLLTLSPAGQYPPAPPKGREPAGNASGGGTRARGGSPTTTTTAPVPEPSSDASNATRTIEVPAPPAAADVGVVQQAAPDVALPVASTDPTAIPSPTTRLGVEVKGIQFENTSAPATPVTDVAFTGVESSLMASIAAALIAVGAFALIAARKRRLQ